jgi:predicted nucleic acid-binding protein
MKVLLDTSVLVPAFVCSLPRHGVGLSCYRNALSAGSELFVAAHSLAEVYAVLTRLPVRPRISGGMARRIIRENIGAEARVVSLGARDHDAVLDRMADLGLTGGTVYDALIVQAALKAKVDRLFTFNGAHFRRVWPGAGDRLAVLA